MQEGTLADQYHHSVDIVPTILEACGVAFPDTYNGVEQTPRSGVSMVSSFSAAPDGPTDKQTQYYEMLGSRGIWHEGGKAVAVHGPVSGISGFDHDEWELYHTEIPERSAANVHGVSYKIAAEVEFTPETQGVIFAHGSRFGGHALVVKDGQVHYVYNFLGIPPEDRVSAPVPTSGKHIIGVEFVKEGMGEYREGVGPVRLYIDEQQVGEKQIRTVLGHFSLCGEGLTIGRDSADPVSSLYGYGFDFTGGEISKVIFDIADDAYLDLEAHLAAAYARD